MINSKIRAGIEKIISDSITPIRVDFKEEGLNVDEFVRVSNPIIVSNQASMGSKHIRHNCRVVIRVFAKTKAKSISILDTIFKEFDLFEEVYTHNDLVLTITSHNIEYSGKDASGSYYQLNGVILFELDEF